MSMEVEASSDLTLHDGRPLGMVNFTDGELTTQQIAQDPQMRQIASMLSRWVDNARNVAGRTTMFDRGAYTPPENPYDEMRAARTAVRYDSVVAGVAEITEAFAFGGVKWEGESPDEADVFNQLSIDIDLDQAVRKMWREEYTYGQVVCAKQWGWTEYTVRGKSKNGNKRKKTYRVWAPLRLTVLDSLKCVPVGHGPLREDLIAWQATPGEIGDYQLSYRGDKIDPLMVSFFSGTYVPDVDETAELATWNVDPARLLLMNPEWVFRHTLTRSDYQKFADIRLKSVFRLLDLKNQLMTADRAMLVGAANYILLIQKGTDDKPATAEELSNLKEGYRAIAKMPVIISDHRLNIEIIAPKADLTLDSKKYDTLDQRILNRLLGTLTNGAGGSASRNDNQEKLSASVARVMENRRHMLRRTLEREIARAVVRHPKNRGVFETEPSLVYTPRNIGLAMDPAYQQALIGLRASREISRETVLEFFGLDEATEAMRMEMEAELYDDIFMSQVPYSAAPGTPPGAAPADKPADAEKTKDGANTDPKSMPASGRPSDGKKKTGPNGTPEPPSVSGARGGRPIGGGKTAANPTKTAAPKTAGGNQKTGK